MAAHSSVSMAPSAAMTSSSNPFVELIESLANRHGEVDMHLERLRLKLPMIREPIELSGTVTVAIKFRPLTERENQASVAREIRIHAR
jgi:hypothetical protein